MIFRLKVFDKDSRSIVHETKEISEKICTCTGHLFHLEEDRRQNSIYFDLELKRNMSFILEYTLIYYRNFRFIANFATVHLSHIFEILLASSMYSETLPHVRYAIIYSYYVKKSKPLYFFTLVKL